ncbi:MAG: hypothetical protein K2X82_26070, partial [Gemmataceae bacterium]|nr:hypothetical protein [Gemmataceae bacterium]
LEAAARGTDPEAARRAGLILTRLGRASDSAKLLAAKRVKLDYRGVPLGAAVNDLRARTGIPLTLDAAGVADPARPVTCTAGELPAWEAVAAFCRAAGLREVFAADLDAPKPETKNRRGYYTPPPPLPLAEAVPVVLTDGPYRHLPGSRAAAVRVLALPAAFPRNRVLLGTGEVTLSFDVTPSPGLEWQDAGVAVRVTKVVDEFGRPGTGGGARDPEPTPFNPFGGQVFVGRGVALRWDPDGNPITPPTHPNPRVVAVPLQVATPHARSLRRLEGVVAGEVMVPGQVLAAVANPAGAQGATAAGPDGVKLTVQGCEPGGAGRPAVVRVRVEAPSPWLEARRRNPWGPIWPEPGRPPGHQVEAFDAAGKPVPTTASQTQANDDGMTLSTATDLTFAGGVLPARLVLTGPRRTPVEIPFVMEDVPLP